MAPEKLFLYLLVIKNSLKNKTMKLTIKEKVLRFVEERGSVRFTDIQRFIVDMKFGQGTYDGAKRYERVYINGEYRDRLVNPYRGYYSTNLTPGGRWSKPGYMRCGPDYLVKSPDGQWSVVRTTERKVEPVQTVQNVENKEPEMINLYTVDEVTGKLSVVQRPKFDRSWMTNPLIFDEYLTAVAYAEPVQEKYAARMLSEDEMDIILEEAEEEIAEEMIQEISEPVKDLNLHDLIKNLLPVKIGQEIFILEQEDGCIARMYKSTVSEVALYITKNETRWEIMTNEDDSFGDKDLNVKFFKGKGSCLEALNKLF